MMLSKLIRWIRHYRAIRTEALALFLEYRHEAAAIARAFATEPSAPAEQRWFYMRVTTAIEKLERKLRGLDTATRYVEYDRLGREYERFRIEPEMQASSISRRVVRSRKRTRR